MASDREISDNDILHFDELNTTVVSLTDAEKAALESKGVTVVEDIEFHALEVIDAPGDETDLLDPTLTDRSNPLTGDDTTGNQMYMRGFADGQKMVKDDILKLLNRSGQQPTETDEPQTAPKPAPTPSAPAAAQPLPWNIRAVKAPGAWARGITGFGVKVAVLDTGIAHHADLIISGGASFVTGVSSFNDDNGHGTHCAGIIGARNNAIGVVGVAPRSSLFAVKVLNSAGSGAFSQIVAGLAWALANKMHVISMSLGAEVPFDHPAVAALRGRIQILLNAGITVVAAAGNSFQHPSFPFVNAPGNIKGVIAVGATDQNNVIAPFSSRGGTGNPVTISAPGVSIVSTFPFPANSYKSLSGTSMACPHVAGAVALVKQKFPAFTPAQIQAKLRLTARDLGVPGTDPTYGSGLLNCDGATL